MSRDFFFLKPVSKIETYFIIAMKLHFQIINYYNDFILVHALASPSTVDENEAKMYNNWQKLGLANVDKLGDFCLSGFY